MYNFKKKEYNICDAASCVLQFQFFNIFEVMFPFLDFFSVLIGGGGSLCVPVFPVTAVQAQTGKETRINMSRH
jgi:hypothetical protein